MGTRQDNTSHVSRVLGLLELIGEQPEPRTLSELARIAQLPISTVHRLLGELVTWGGVERTPDGSYQLGEKIWRLGVTPTWERNVREAALLHVVELVSETGASVALSALSNDRLVCVNTVQGRFESIYLAKAGDELPLFATSAGKLLMSTAERSVLLDAMRTKLVRRTPYTQILPRLLLEQLSQARTHHFAVDHSESRAGQSTLSVRVDDTVPHHGPIALTILVPATHAARLDRYLPALRRTAATISRAITQAA